MKKYFLVNAWCRVCNNEWMPESIFTDQHPIELVAEYNNSNHETHILGWQEISKSDYDLAQSLGL